MIMKKLQFLVCFLLLSVASYAAERTIQLPKPDMNRAGLLMKALSERHSTREYASKALSNTDLSDLLWAANGINRSSEGKRTAPSAMNRQDIDIYVVLPQGTYLYDAKGHKLNLISEGDHRSAVAGGQTFVNNAPVSLVLVSDLSKLGDAKSNSIDGSYGCRDCFAKHLVVLFGCTSGYSPACIDGSGTAQNCFEIKGYSNADDESSGWIF
ncbi:dehydrogenase [Bacteroides fragilis]|nr:dehydrogenase [Bacteroides fragilis]